MPATDIEKLMVQLSMDMSKYEKALARANGTTNRQMRAIENRFATMNKRLVASSSAAANGAMKAFALIGGAQGFRVLSDSATRIDNALKVAGLSGAALEDVYQKLFESAKKNAAPLETLVELYGRASLVQKELGVTSDDLIGFTDNIAVALRASGKSSQEANGALLQLSQALGSGTVRAEEFNSILEGAPTILQAAAAGIKQAGGSVAELRKIMLAGGLSSKALFDGIGAGAPLLETKVAGAILTVDSRLENLRTSLTDAARRFNASSHAANTFGSAIDNMSSFVNSVDMDGLAEDIGKIIELLNQAGTAAQNLGLRLGELSGLEKIGQSIVDRFGKDGKISFLGGALNIQSTATTEDKLSDLANERLTVEKKIAELRSNPVYLQSGLQDYEARLDAINKKTGEIADKITGGPLDYDRFSPPTKSSVGGNKFTPIDLSEPQYKTDGSGSSSSKSGRSSRVNEYEREIRQITERTAALKAATAAQAGLNPFVSDYGFAVEYAGAKQDLLTSAQQAGVNVTPALTASIEGLAKGYANAVVASDLLSEKQDEIRQRAQEAMETAKDVTRGLIDGFVQGASAADLLKDSLTKIADTLLDDVLNSIFKINGASGGGGFLDGIFSLFKPGSSSSRSLPGLADGGFVGAITSTNKPELHA